MHIFNRKSTSYKRSLIVMTGAIGTGLFMLSLKTMKSVDGKMFWDINYVCIVFLIAAVADFLNTFRNRKAKKKNLEYENQGKIWDILSIDKYPESYLGPAIKVTIWLLLLLLLLPINSNSNTIDIWGVGRLLCFYFAMRTSAEFLIVRENREKARKLWKKQYKRRKE